MNELAKYPSHIESIKIVIQSVTQHFSNIGVTEEMGSQIIAAADLSFADALLLEKFKMWNEERDDDVFLYHIGRYFEKRDISPLPLEERDLTYRRDDVEKTIKESARAKRGRVFGKRLTSLAISNNLITNEELGNFLNIDKEEARRYKSGENCPQIKTIKKVSDKFEVSMDYLVGITEDPSL